MEAPEICTRSNVLEIVFSKTIASAMSDPKRTLNATRSKVYLITLHANVKIRTNYNI